MNKVLLVGRIARVNAPVQGATNIRCNFTIAVDNARKAEKSSATFLPCVAWNETANFIGKYVPVGTLVSIVGRIEQRSYLSSKTNQQVSAINIVVENIDILQRKRSDNEELNISKSTTVSMSQLFPENGEPTNMESSDQNTSAPQFDTDDEHDWLDEIEANDKGE